MTSPLPYVDTVERYGTDDVTPVVRGHGGAIRHYRTVRHGTTVTVLYNGVDLAGAPVPLSVQAYAVDVWYDAPAPHSEGSAERFEPALSVLLSSAESVPADNRVPLIQVDLAGRTLKALVDTGASDDFISSAEVNALGLCPQSSEWSQ
ncbi:hypothetical protein Vretifemale_1486, partial [Volvox reticuliferus]